MDNSFEYYFGDIICERTPSFMMRERIIFAGSTLEDKQYRPNLILYIVEGYAGAMTKCEIDFNFGESIKFSSPYIVYKRNKKTKMRATGLIIETISKDRIQVRVIES